MFEGLRFNHWKTSEGDDGIVTLTLDRADTSVNAISRAVLNELEQIVERLAIEKPAGVIIHSAKPSGFAVGADIKAFVEYARHDTVLENIEHGQRVYEALARLPCPTVAAVHGACMGGGTELILACRQRIAVDDEKTRIGLPEVMLGIHPGWGGTARLPRLIGATDALPIMLTGRALSARRALALGMVDRLARADELLAEAKLLLRRPHARPFTLRAKAWATNTWLARQLLAPMVIKQTAAKVRKEHYPAPFATIDVWKRGGSSIQQRLKLEARSVARLATTPTAQNLIRIFFLQERLKGQGGGIDPGIKHVHVVGAGVMGGDIAAWAAFKGFEVTLQDREMKFIQPALDRARQLYEKKLKSPEKVEAAARRLRADVDGSGVASADLAIEAIYENPEAKRELYARIEPQFQADEILASNTSSIPLDELRQGLKSPQRFLGLHFFNPVAQMPLVEVVRHDQLDPTVEKRALAFCKAIGKLPVAVKGTPGLPGQPHPDALPAGSHAPVQRRGAGPGAGSRGEEVRHADGSDRTGRHRRAWMSAPRSAGNSLPSSDWRYRPGWTRNSRPASAARRTARALYVWQDGKPQKPEVDKDYVMPPDLQERMILPMVNEAIACLADGVVDDADLLDAGVIFGTGFAPFRGGPIQYARSEGVDKLKARLQQLAQRYGERFSPKNGWDDPALSRSGFELAEPSTR